MQIKYENLLDDSNFLNDKNIIIHICNDLGKWVVKLLVRLPLSEVRDLYYLYLKNGKTLGNYIYNWKSTN